MTDRVHPYELVFGGGKFESEVFPGIRAEANARGVDIWSPQSFLMLQSVGELMRSLAPPDASVPAVTQFGAMVTQAYHFWHVDKPTFAIDEPVLRRLLSAGALLGPWDMTPPSPAGYVQLPRNLVFARIEEAAQAEAVDGFFYTMPGAGDPDAPRSERLEVLLVLGLVRNRAGFSVISVGAPVAADAPGHFGDVVARESGSDFENVLPGGEDRLFAVTNELEVLKLVARCFWSIGNQYGG